MSGETLIPLALIAVTGGIAAAPLLAGGAAAAGAGAAGAGAAASGFVPAAAGGFQLATGAAAGGSIFTAGNVALGASLLSGASAVMSGIQQNAAAKAEAGNIAVQSQVEQTQSAQRNLERRRQLTRALASQRAAASVSGFEGIGTARRIENVDRSRAARDIADERMASGIQAQGRAASAKSVRRSGTMSLISGGLQGLGAAGQGIHTKKRLG